MVYVVALILSLLVLGIVAGFYVKVKNLDEGTPDMAEKAQIIRHGANVFLLTEYKVITPVVLGLALIFSLFVEKTGGISLLIGASMSTAVCILGMRSATYANVRTTNVARQTLNISKTINVARMGGAVSGLSVQAFGLLGFALNMIIFGGFDPDATSHGLLLKVSCNPCLVRITCYSLGCSVVAMFNRVAGGNFTKAADISADMVSKVRFSKTVIAQKVGSVIHPDQWTDHLKEIVKQGIPEDSFLNPSVLADFIGDCVNDIAGNCSDLLESFVATIAAAILIANFTCQSADSPALLDAMINFVVITAVAGLICCTISILVSCQSKSDDPAKNLGIITNCSAILAIIVSFNVSFMIFDKILFLPDTFRFARAMPLLGSLSPAICVLLGIVSGVIIGKVTEFYTAPKFKPVKVLAESAKEGASFVMCRGDAIGYRSSLAPIAVIAISVLIANNICGMFGVAIASLGMLCTVGAIVTIDAFGPIADNAGGLAEVCGLGEEVREITDLLDAYGNTTAAMGKGAAIGSAAYSATSLIVAFVSAFSVGTVVLNAADPTVLSGMLIGAGLIAFFAGVLTDNTIDSAASMADEDERQLLYGGVLQGTAQPDHTKCIEIATREAIRKMAFPSLIALVAPVVYGLFFGLPAVGGVLLGATLIAVPVAIFLGNSGGAFDNAKKAIEAGDVEGAEKGSEAHMASVVGDTTGDPRKDSVCPSLDIFLKMMTTVANLSVSVLSKVHLVN